MTQRVVIVGGPRVGKSTLSKTFDCYVRHSDDLIDSGLDWSTQSARLANEMVTTDGPWCFEGVRLVHALRKALLLRPGHRFCEKVIVLTQPHEQLSTSQAGFGKGIMKVWREIEGELRGLGIEVEER